MTEAPFGTAGLVGRDAEMRRLTALLDAGGDAALVLTGEAGVGKTALLDAAAQRAAARGVRVVRGSGSEYETEIGFAGLHQLVGELGEEFHALPRTARDALGVALGLLDGAAPSRIAVMNAALTLFRQVASVQPLLLVVDDLHVLDDASRAALGFVGRRLTGSRIALLGARRTGPVARSFALGLEELDLAPLAEADALTLLSRRFAHLPGRVRAELAMQAQGNPLALLEFAGSTTMAGAGREVAPAGGNGRGRDVRALFQERVERLPHATRELLLLLALEGSGDLPTLETASGHEGLDDLQPAERDRLVMVVDGGRVVRFRHPLVRSAVVEASTSAQRRRAHRRLALAVADPVRRGDHWARATTVPDDTVADIVEAASQVGLRRGDAEGAVARLRRAAELSVDPAARDRRLWRAAYLAAWVAGRLDLAREIIEGADVDPSGRSPGEAAAAAFVLLVAEGDADGAHALLMTALARLRPVTTPISAETDVVLFALALSCQYAGREELWRPLVDLASQVADTAPDTAPASALSLVRVHHDPGATTDDALARMDAAIVALADQPEADVVVRTALAASYLDRLPGCRPAVEAVIADGGTVGSSMPALIFVALDDLHAGRWADCARTADELVALCEQTGYHLFGHVGRYLAAMAAAHRGDLEACRAYCEQIWAWAGPRRLRRLEHCAHQAAARAACGAADFATALAHAQAIGAPGSLPAFAPEAVWAAPDLVEAALRTGRIEEARRHAVALRDSGIERISARHALIVATTTAMTAAPEDGLPLFEQAVGRPGVEGHPFELGRAHLAYGELLRRRGRARQARQQLAVARDRFEELGAASWSARVAAELRATGLTRTARGAVGDALTPQELEVAQLAAAGMSNPQIAARLVLSPRTVSTHLYRVFPKLGISSRAGLRDALAAVHAEAVGDDEED